MKRKSSERAKASALLLKSGLIELEHTMQTGRSMQVNMSESLADNTALKLVSRTNVKKSTSEAPETVRSS